MNSPEIQHGHHETAADLANDQEWWEIYRSSFPKEELLKEQTIIDLVQSESATTFYTALNDQSVALAVTLPNKRIPAATLWYLAVSKELKGTGIGSELMHHSLTTNQELFGNPDDAFGLIAEVDDPNEIGISSEERDIRIRRQKFYIERHNGQLLEQEYYLPALNPEDDPYKMDLIVCGEGVTPSPDYAEGAVLDLYDFYAESKQVTRENLDALLNELGIFT